MLWNTLTKPKVRATGRTHSLTHSLTHSRKSLKVFSSGFNSNLAFDFSVSVILFDDS